MGNIDTVALSGFENGFAFVRNDGLTVKFELDRLQFEFFRVGWCVHIYLVFPRLLAHWFFKQLLGGNICGCSEWDLARLDLNHRWRRPPLPLLDPPGFHDPRTELALA